MTPTPLIFMYHAVAAATDSAADPYSICVAPDRFARQMAELARRGWRGVGVSELLAAGPPTEGARLIGLTFDDGYLSVLDAALPILTRYGFGATVYPVAGLLGGQNDWDAVGPRRRLLTEAQVRRLADAGVEIGSHGLAHRSCLELDDAALRRELVDSRQRLEQVSGGPVASYCYPYGHLDARAIAAVRAAGYSSAVGIGSFGSSDPLQLPRIYVGARDGQLRLGAKRLRHAVRHRVGRPVAP